jgi:hypothetical protein
MLTHPAADFDINQRNAGQGGQKTARNRSRVFFDWVDRDHADFIKAMVPFVFTLDINVTS